MDDPIRKREEVKEVQAPQQEPEPPKEPSPEWKSYKFPPIAYN
jgi:hypothetical protein